jgi:hypothetical protein
MVETALQEQAQDPFLFTGSDSPNLFGILESSVKNVDYSKYGVASDDTFSVLNPENRRLYNSLIYGGGEKSKKVKEVITGIDPKQYLENGVSVKDLSSLKMSDISSLLGGKPKQLSGAEKSLLFFLGMAQNAGKAGSTFGGSLTAGTTALGAGMLKRVQDIRKYDRELPLKTLQISNLLSKQESDRRKDTSSFRKEWEGLEETKEMKKQVFAYSRLREAAAIDPDNPLARGVGDLALVFNFMKLLDPGSVVRESEFRAAASAGAFGEKLKNLIDKPLSGALFTPEVRADFVEKAESFLEGRGDFYNQLYEQRKEIALGEGFREKELGTVLPYTDWKEVIKKYGSFRKEQKDNEGVVKKAEGVQAANFNTEQKALYDQYEQDFSSHPKADDIGKILKKGSLSWSSLTPIQKVNLLQQVESLQ